MTKRMKTWKWRVVGAVLIATLSLAGLTHRLSAQASSDKPNILFVMTDDVGWMTPGVYHQGLMVGETPNIDRIAKEGVKFLDAYSEQSCTAGRNAFMTGMNPLRTGLIVPQLPGSPSWLRSGTPSLAKILLDLGYNTGQFGKNHLGDNVEALPTAHGFQEYWGYLYHLDAMQQVSFPDVYKDKDTLGVAPPCKATSIPGVPDDPNAVDPATTTCLTPPRPVLWCHSADGTQAKQTCKDEGPVTDVRSETLEEEVSAKVIDFLDRNDPKKTGKPFFAYYNTVRMHVDTFLPKKYLDMLGTRGGKDWGINEAGEKQMDDNLGYVLKKLEDIGQLDNTIIIWTSDNGAQTQTYPDGGITPFKGDKLTTWEGGMRVPLLVRWPGHIKPGTVTNQIFSMLDWLPTLVNIAGGPKGDGLKKKIEAGQYPGFLKTTLDGFDQRDFLEGKSDSARDHLFYYTGTIPSAVRYKNWKMYYTMEGSTSAGALKGAQSYGWTQMTNLMRDPFEQNVGDVQKSATSIGGAITSPSTAYLYDWQMLPIGQLLWMKELETYRKFPPLQVPASYNLDEIEKLIAAQASHSHSD